MNWKYTVGRTINQTGRLVSRWKWMPLIREFPQGISYSYDIKRYLKRKPVQTIFDAGANVGQTSLMLNWHFPDAKIFAFEPVKATYETLQRNTSIKANIQPIHTALGSKAEQKTIELREFSEVNTLVNSIDSSSTPSEQVETVQVSTIDDFCHQNQIDRINLLKMDVQGYELEVLRGAEHFLDDSLIDFVYSEVGFNPEDLECQQFESLNQFLKDYDFQFSRLYEVWCWGENKQYFGFCNALFVNKRLWQSEALT